MGVNGLGPSGLQAHMGPRGACARVQGGLVEHTVDGVLRALVMRRERGEGFTMGLWRLWLELMRYSKERSEEMEACGKFTP